MIRMGQVQNCVAQQDHQLFVFPVKGPGQRVILGFGDESFSSPLPKLSLRGPEFLAITTDDERRFFLYTSVPACLFTRKLAANGNTRYPLGKPLGEAASVCQNFEVRNLEFRNSPHNNNREINSARRFTPNFMKMWRK
jgi:hypothetical protein